MKASVGKSRAIVQVNDRERHWVSFHLVYAMLMQVQTPFTV
jgi:hypothetical protein